MEKENCKCAECKVAQKRIKKQIEYAEYYLKEKENK